MPNLSKELMPHFIRGYFNGDGCITYSIKKRIRYKFSIVGEKDMLKTINDELNQNMNIYNINHSLALDLSTTNRKKIINIYHYLYDNATIYLTRKKEKFDYLLSLFAGMQSKEQSELRGKAK